MCGIDPNFSPLNSDAAVRFAGGVSVSVSCVRALKTESTQLQKNHWQNYGPPAASGLTGSWRNLTDTKNVSTAALFRFSTPDVARFAKAIGSQMTHALWQQPPARCSATRFR
jgi:hypothetical protein